MTLQRRPTAEGILSGETVNVVSDAEHASVVEELHAAVLGYIRLYPNGGG